MGNSSTDSQCYMAWRGEGAGKKAGLPAIEYDGTVGTGRDASMAAIAQAGVDEGRFARVKLKDRLCTADFAGQTLATSLA